MRRLLGLLAAVALAGCQEKLTQPADCPALCPGGQPEVFDEVFGATPGADSSYVGYVQAHQAVTLLASNGLQGFEERPLVRFLARADSVAVRDTLRGYTIDSVAFSFTVAARDTNLDGVDLLLYRVAPTFDSASSYADVAAAFNPENLVTTLHVPDSINTGVVRTVLQGPDLSRVQIAPGDSGKMALGVRIQSPTPTGLRLGALSGGNAPVFTTYTTLDVPDTGTARLRTLALSAAFNTYVSEAPDVIDTTLLSVGGAPSARAMLRFSLPPRIMDSATIVRATLELTPVTPVTGLPTDPARLLARAVLSDVGAKSPVSVLPGRVPEDTLEIGTAAISMEVVRLVELWLGETNRPTALMLSVEPQSRQPLAPFAEASSFSHPAFYSSRAADPALRPRLRLSYLLSFPFETP